MSDYNIRRATVEDHERILEISKKSPYIKDFSNRMMFSTDSAYEKGWILVAENRQDGIIGFSCVRHKVRAPVTMLYFIGVKEQYRKQGIAEALLKTIMYEGPHRTMELNVMKDNNAYHFYKRLHFTVVGDAMKGEAYRMRRDY